MVVSRPSLSRYDAPSPQLSVRNRIPSFAVRVVRPLLTLWVRMNKASSVPVRLVLMPSRAAVTLTVTLKMFVPLCLRYVFLVRMLSAVRVLWEFSSFRRELRLMLYVSFTQKLLLSRRISRLRSWLLYMDLLVIGVPALVMVIVCLWFSV